MKMSATTDLFGLASALTSMVVLADEWPNLS